MSGRIAASPADAHGIARLTIANAGKRNAIDVAMWGQLREAVAALDADRAARVVVVAGADGHFAAGADIEELPAFRFDEASLRHFHEDVVAPALEALLDCELPLVARIEGHCIGGGLEIAACCDLRIAARGASFGIPVARLGFPLAPGEAVLLRRVLPDALLRELLLEARLLDAEGALARGLVHRLADDVDAEAEAAARRMAELPADVLRLNKRTLRQIQRGGPTPAERAAHFAYAPAGHHREGIAAFLEKRPPKFRA